MPLHRPGGYIEPSSGSAGSPCISGRTLIACQTCASAKTGCDKKVPCGRCLEKNIQCTARYARRASKAAIRAAQSASSSTKNQMAGFAFGSQQRQKNSFSYEVGNYAEAVSQESLQQLPSNGDQHDDALWDILNPLSPLSGYPDNLNTIEHKHESPIAIGFSEYTASVDLLPNDPSMRVPRSHDFFLDNLINGSNKPHLFSEIPYLSGAKDLSSMVQTSDTCKDTPSFFGGCRNLELDIGSAPSEPHSWTRPCLCGAQSWMRRLRLAYDWVQIDQELSLFHDTEQTLSNCDLERPLPDPNSPWTTRDIIRDSQSYLSDGLHVDAKAQEAFEYDFRPSLSQLFKGLVHDATSGRVPPRHLRLLLHPLQALVNQSQRLLSFANHNSSPVLSEVANSALLETQRLLRAWYRLALEAQDEHAYMPDADTTLGMVLYHLICLNLAASFVDIERLADRKNIGIGFWQQSLQQERSIYSRQQAIFHCGQALRYLRAVSIDSLPWWWPTAVHRAITTLWAASILGSGPTSFWPRDAMDIVESGGTNSSVVAPAPEPSIIAIDNVAPEDPAFGDANWSERHLLVLTAQDEAGGVVVLTDATAVLRYGISLIRAFSSSVDGEAVVTKLKDLGQAWGLGAE
ncbi:hypothetical protein BBK36DRAFT_1178629 [Trichoderma citrinoviride]|uniref:Zn(2)-C6 fungal-type domain-containing protein n=1 Tax=Trichoderma citrinoviride TaxID=58853 RepID=A0A2T4B4N8_9HYPO|nr:hypothetical protein BBK36DRAFT_1178629 [Trichoderma citrinoviride]PTB64209.1 hypothetical protein BBK36DRAFT_1178629 [Trichoderma citrinoviride]